MLTIPRRKGIKIEERLDLGKFVSPISDINKPPFNWYSFKNGFSSELVSNVLSILNLSKRDLVFDPFCGGGTTLIKAKIEGYNSFGLDITPFSVFISNALTTNYSPKKIKDDFKKINHNINPKVEIPNVPILTKSFSDNTLKYIFSVRNSINELDNPSQNFYLLVLLSILDRISKAKKSGGFLRITNQRKVALQTVKNKFIKTYEKFIQDLNVIKYKKAQAVTILGDARAYPQEIANREFDAIITSPPYPNRHDYTRIFALELLVGFLNSNEDLKKLRYGTLRSHVEAKQKYNGDGYVKPKKLHEILSSLKERELNNQQIISTIAGYFEDMYLCLKQMNAVLKKSKYIGLVVSNVRFAGLMIPVDELLIEIGGQVGLELKNIYVLRYRGNSAQQMQKYNREPSRESLIIWQK
jgi:DNA modification methylase